MATLLGIASALCLNLTTASAQSPTPSPTPVAAGGRTLSEHIAGLSLRASEMFPPLQFEVLSRILDWCEKFSVLLAAAVILFSFLRVWRENNGRGSNLFWWFARLGVCLALIGSGPYLIERMYQVGKEVAEGSEMAGKAGKSVLYEFYLAQRDSFDESYTKLTQGTFTVKVDGEDFPVAPSSNGSDTFLGVLYDQEATVKDINNRLNDSSWTLPTLFSWLSVARGILEFGDFWLICLAGILLMVFKVVAPFMVVLGIDQRLSSKVSYPFAWGAVVLTLVWPSVSYFIRALAYLVGNLAMALGDADPLYVWDYASLQAIRSPLAQPVYTVGIAAFLMTIAGLCLWVSPYIAFRVSMGQVYEGISSTASQWAGAVIGTVVETVSARAAAAIGHQAANTQAMGSYGAETTRAGGDYQAANLAARARQVMGVAAVRGSQAAQLGQIYAARTNQVMSAQAGMLFGINSAGATAALSKSDTQVRTDQSVNDLRIGRDQQTANIETNRAADTQRWRGDKLIMAGNYAGSVIRGDSEAMSGRSIAGGAVEVGVGGAGLHQQYKSIQNRATGQQSALDTATQGQIANRQEAAQGYMSNQDAYVSRMTEYHKQYAAGLTSAANASSAQAAGGVNRGASIQIGAINRGTGMELQGNQTRYDSQVEAAKMTRDAAMEAARLQALSSVVGRVGSKIARDIEKGLEMRY